MADYTIELTAKEYEVFKSILKKAKKAGAVVKKKHLHIYASICEKMRSHTSNDRDRVIDICGKLLADKAARDSVKDLGRGSNTSEWHRLYAKFGLKRWDSLESKFSVSTQLEGIIDQEINFGFSSNKARKKRGYRRNTIAHQLALLWDYLIVAAHGVDQFLYPHIKYEQEMPRQRWKHRVSWQRFYVDLTLGIDDPTNESLGSWLHPGSNSYTTRNKDLKALLFLLGRAYVLYQRNIAHSNLGLIKENGPHLLVVDGSTGHPIVTKRL
jgi:hypothetical protein